MSILAGQGIDKYLDNRYNTSQRIGRLTNELRRISIKNTRQRQLDDVRRKLIRARSGEPYRVVRLKPVSGSRPALPQEQPEAYRVRSFEEIMDETEYDPLDYNAAEAEAVRGVEEEMAGSFQRELRELGRTGVSPTSGRARSSSERRALNLALARSGARLEARKSVDEANFQRQQASREQALALRGQDITLRGQDVSARTSREALSQRALESAREFQSRRPYIERRY